jgi:hypothetical protein
VAFSFQQLTWPPLQHEQGSTIRHKETINIGQDEDDNMLVDVGKDCQSKVANNTGDIHFTHYCHASK